MKAYSTQDDIDIGGGISSNVSYTGSQSFNGATCNISSNYCSLQVNGSQLSVTGLFIVSVVATNAVGSGNSTVFPTQSKCFTETVLHRSVNDVYHTVPSNIGAIADVVIDVSQATVTCTLLPSYRESTNGMCSITYGPSPNNCSLITNSAMATPNNSVILNLTRLVAEEYCYTVELDHGDTVLSITGTFRLGKCCDGVHLLYL